MKGMKLSVGVLAILTVGAVGCGKSDSNNATPVPPVSNNQTPSVDTNVESNAPLASNNAPVEDNNAPVVTNPPTNNNSPDSNNKPPITTDKKPVVKPPEKKPEPTIKEPPAVGQDGWTKSQIEAKNITEAVDANVKAIKNMRMNLRIDFSAGKAKGTFNDACYIADQNRYLLKYMTYNPKTDVHPEDFVVMKKDGKDSTFVIDKYQPGRITPDKDTLKGWALNSTHYISAGVGTDRKPYTELITAAQKAKWKINVESKKYPNGEFQRIVMESPNEPKRRYELLVQPKMKLPVQFNAAIYEKQKIVSALLIGWDQSDRPLTDEQMSPKVKTEEVNVLTREEAIKKGIKIKP
jgi:hypothetical protein